MNSPKKTLVVATGNPGKLREIRAVLSSLPVNVLGLCDFPAIDEPVESGPTFGENARAKAIYYARSTGQWCLADDSGLVVDALAGRPGLLSARYANGECPPNADRVTMDRANNAKLLGKLANVPDEQRTARFVCHLALADLNGILLEVCDTIEGRIAHALAGAGGFGYDPLFLVEALGKTTAELTAEGKNAVSHRGKAARRFAELLRDMLERTTTQNSTPD